MQSTLFKWLGIEVEERDIDQTVQPKFRQLTLDSFLVQSERGDDDREGNGNDRLNHEKTKSEGPIFPQLPSSRKVLYKKDEPFPLSRTKIENYMKCPRCFYMNARFGISPPPGNDSRLYRIPQSHVLIETTCSLLFELIFILSII